VHDLCACVFENILALMLNLQVSGAPVVASIPPNISRMEYLDRNSPAKPSTILVW
jgi:hypothetical protein